MRGFHDFFYIKQEIRQFRLNNNFQFFNNIRDKLLLDSQIKIKYHWKRYKKRKMVLRAKLMKKQTTTNNNDSKYKIYKVRGNDKRPSILPKVNAVK